jgi:hypothetical protein
VHACGRIGFTNDRCTMTGEGGSQVPRSVPNHQDEYHRFEIRHGQSCGADNGIKADRAHKGNGVCLAAVTASRNRPNSAGIDKTGRLTDTKGSTMSHPFLYITSGGWSRWTSGNDLTMRFLTSTSIFAFLALTPTVFAQDSFNSSNVALNFNCSSFNPAQNGGARLNYTVAANQTLRVSRAFDCPPSSDSDRACAFTPRGRLNVNYTTNATDISDPNILHAMLYKARKSEGATTTELSRFDRNRNTLSFNGTGQPRYAEQGTSAYIGFRPNMTCYEGIVSTDDSCKELDDGVRNVKSQFEQRALTICVPMLDQRTGKPSSTRLVGTTEVVEISAEEAKKPEMSRNPAYLEGDEDDEDDDHSVSVPRPSNAVIIGRGGRVEVRGLSVVLGFVAAWIGLIM